MTSGDDVRDRSTVAGWRFRRRQSMRRYALDQLGVSWIDRRWTDRRRLIQRLAGVALVAGIFLLTFLPQWQFDVGPFRSADEAEDYLQTLWQVVAAAVGVWVALIAFVFEAFVSSGERRHGGTLREFARQTRILVLFDLAAISLILDGLALAGLGGTAPAGWPGFAASFASGLTLLVLLIGVPRVILRSLFCELCAASR